MNTKDNIKNLIPFYFKSYYVKGNMSITIPTKL